MGRNSQLPASPWGERGLDGPYYIYFPTLKTFTQQKAPNHLALGVSRAFNKGFQGTLANKAAWLLAVGSTESRQKCSFPSLSHFPFEGLTAYFTSCCGRIQLLTSVHQGDDWIIRRAWVSLGALALLPTLVHSDNKTKSPVFPWKELVHISSAPTFTAATWPGLESQLDLHGISQDYSKQISSF